MPNLAVPDKLIAACLGLTGFAMAIVAGLAAGNAATAVLRHSLIAMVACYGAGLVVGAVARAAAGAQFAATSSQSSESSESSEPSESSPTEGSESPQSSRMARAA